MSYLNFISCATCHGEGAEKLFQGLMEKPSPNTLSDQWETPFLGIPGRMEYSSVLQAFESLIQRQLDQIDNSLLGASERWGLVFASTKGRIEDLIWNDERPKLDPYCEILSNIEKQVPFAVQRSLAVSNACTSSHGALGLAKTWLDSDQLDHVLVVAGDLIGPFTLKGFSTLRALSPDRSVRPFDVKRNGLILGDGIATAILSQKPSSGQSAKLRSITTLCEGVSATRPDTTGVNLAQCFATTHSRPDLILTHGTATLYNDLTEANAIHRAFAHCEPPKVTASKWSVGHTLGASGLIDLCLATEIYKKQIAPGILTLEESDLPIQESLVRETTSMKIQNLLISSLGFGGMCSAMDIHWEEPI